jgi:uncharacterized protein YukE
MALSYNYTAVDTHTLTFQGIVNNIQTNNGNLQAMEASLKGAFTGEGATAWHGQIDRLMAKVGAYRDALDALQRKVTDVAGNSGAMHVTDKNQGGRFMSVNI